MRVLSSDGIEFPITVPVLIIGGGACGMIAALAAHDLGAEVLILERDATPRGSTALSSGMIPACGTKYQKDKKIDDSVAIMSTDIQKKADGQADQDIVQIVCETSGLVIDWLSETHNTKFKLVEGFLYPGHSVLRMHAPIAGTGQELMDNLSTAVGNAGIDILENAHTTILYTDQNNSVKGVQITRPDGSEELIGCDTLILACNGYGGNREMVAHYIPKMANAMYFGHPGNKGDAVIWGQKLGADTQHMSACQGHGSVAIPHGILITWALMMEGGLQVNASGERFSNEHAGYSEQAIEVLQQDGGVVWNIYDLTCHELGLTFDDYRNAECQGAIKTADTIADLALIVNLPIEALKHSITQMSGTGIDRYGRDLSKTGALKPPYYAVKVTGALFHTQGGLKINTSARVLHKKNAEPLPNLFAGGGASCGISGAQIKGYLSGNGLLTAFTLGYIAGKSAAEMVVNDCTVSDKQ